MVVVAVLLRVICNNVRNLLYYKTSLHLCLVSCFRVKVFGVSLSQQELGSDGIPHLVAKCLQFVETYGM